MSIFKKRNKKISVEEAINRTLKGDAQVNALDFAAFAQANGITFDGNKDGTGWAVGGTVGDSLGYMMINGASKFPGPWTIWFNACDFDESVPVDEALKEAAWAHVSPCGHCHKGWKECGSLTWNIFGKEFESLCHSPLMFTNPDAPTLEHVKKLTLLLKQNKQGEPS